MSLLFGWLKTQDLVTSIASVFVQKCAEGGTVSVTVQMEVTALGHRGAYPL